MTTGWAAATEKGCKHNRLATAACNESRTVRSLIAIESEERDDTVELTTTVATKAVGVELNVQAATDSGSAEFNVHALDDV